jgi:hypothetical protein
MVGNHWIGNHCSKICNFEHFRSSSILMTMDANYRWLLLSPDSVSVGIRQRPEENPTGSDFRRKVNFSALRPDLMFLARQIIRLTGSEATEFQVEIQVRSHQRLDIRNYSESRLLSLVYVIQPAT